jgi:hypothetical protein
MPAALSEGWLIALIGIFGPSLLAALAVSARWVAKKWREPYLAELKVNGQLVSEIKETKEELAAKTNELSRCEIKGMFYEQRLLDLERELEGWREGRYRSTS